MSKWHRTLFLLVSIMMLPLLYLYATTSQFGFLGGWSHTNAKIITDMSLTMGETQQDIVLPHTFETGSPGQLLTFTTQLEKMGGERIYVKSVFAPLRVYANDRLIYDYGQEGTVGHYFQDPPVAVGTVMLPDQSPITLRMEYLYPTTRGDLTVEPPLVGSYATIFSTLLRQSEQFSALCIFFLCFGVLLLCMGLFARIFEPQGNSLLWLAMIVLLCGLWGFGEHDIAGLFIHNPSMLYLMSFTGLYYVPVSVHFYFRSIVGYRNPWPITVCGRSALILATVATLLQCFGVLSFYNAIPYFAVLTTAGLIFGLGYTAYEWLEHGNQMAKLSLMPWVVVIVSALVEGVRFAQKDRIPNGFFVQLGLLMFILMNSIIGGILVRKTLKLRVENRRMEQEYKIMEIQVTEQKRYHHLLMETRQTLREQRHDLRHQLAAIRNLAQEGKWDSLNCYLDDLNDEVPEEMRIYCDNMAVNAVVAYYVAKAESNGVAVTVQTVVPQLSEKISDSSLCVVFGNILENAVEACGRMKDSGKFINLTSYLRNGMLVITLKNSFEGPIHQTDGKFHSSKRDDFGVGLISVQSVARKHGGDGVFTQEGRTFQSAIYVQI